MKELMLNKTGAPSDNYEKWSWRGFQDILNDDAEDEGELPLQLHKPTTPRFLAIQAGTIIARVGSDILDGCVNDIPAIQFEEDGWCINLSGDDSPMVGASMGSDSALLFTDDNQTYYKFGDDPWSVDTSMVADYPAAASSIQNLTSQGVTWILCHQ